MLLIAGWPVVLMVTTGRSPAVGQFDAAIVFGARVYEDGTLSDALEDRVLAAIALYEGGRCDAIIMSGGPGDGAIHEADAMRSFAIDAGVPASAIIIDRDGVSTRATCENARDICLKRGFGRVVGVTHFYHTPRVEMGLHRAGFDTDTEPSSMRGRVLNRLPYFMAREAAVWWVYLVNP